MAAPGPSVPLELRRLASPEEFRAVEAVQVAAWGMTEEHPVPVPIQRAMADNGGLALGAFVGSDLVGFCLGFLGREGGLLYHYSHMTAVRPESQNRHLGLRLKRFQREEVLGQGLEEIRWTFDPLRSRNAFLNLRRLGAVCDAYHLDYYGPMGSDVNRGLRTDRLRVRWHLNAPSVIERTQDRYPTHEADAVRLHRAQPLIASVPADGGNRRPAGVSSPGRPEVTIEVPRDLDALRATRPGGVLEWRDATRKAFGRAFESGYRAVDFTVAPVDGELRAFYFLSAAESPRAPAHG